MWSLKLLSYVNLRFKILLGEKGEKLSNGIGTFFYQKELNDSNIKTKTTVFLKFSKLKNQKTNHILKLAPKEPNDLGNVLKFFKFSG